MIADEGSDERVFGSILMPGRTDCSPYGRYIAVVDKGYYLDPEERIWIARWHGSHRRILLASVPSATN